MKIAIVHDWLTVYSGAEKVLEHMLALFPQADLFTSFNAMLPNQQAFLKGKKINTTFLQAFPFLRKFYRYYFPWMPKAVEQFDLRDYNLIISNSWGIAKGVITGPDQLHLCYCCTPTRYLWEMHHQYLEGEGLSAGWKGALFGGVVRGILHKMRIWDYQSAQRVDSFVAISSFIARRIKKCYRRNATVIYPPVDVDKFKLTEKKEDYYLTVSRCVFYKKQDIIVEAFCQMPEKKLIVIGDGPELPRLKQRKASNIVFLGYQSFSVLKNYLELAKAFVFAAIEDFGIAPVEALACGTPVIAYKGGGVKEIIFDLDHPSPTGCFFEEQTTASVMQAIRSFEQERKKIFPEACRERALFFSPDTFREQFSHFVKNEITKHMEQI